MRLVQEVIKIATCEGDRLGVYTGESRAVPCSGVCGLYAAHRSHRGRGWTVTHIPTGRRIVEVVEPEHAWAWAAYLHETAGDAGKGAPFGAIRFPGADVIKAAYQAQVSG